MNNTHPLLNPTMADLMKKYMKQYEIAVMVIYRELRKSKNSRIGRIKQIRTIRLRKHYGRKF